jgi:uncharacterized coiled-coil protein SlyX
VPNLEARVSALDGDVRSILTELGGLSIQLAHVSEELDQQRERVSTLLNNMAQNTLDNQRRVSQEETSISDLRV